MIGIFFARRGYGLIQTFQYPFVPLPIDSSGCHEALFSDIGHGTVVFVEFVFSGMQWQRNATTNSLVVARS